MFRFGTGYNGQTQAVHSPIHKFVRADFSLPYLQIISCILLYVRLPFHYYKFYVIYLFTYPMQMLINLTSNTDLPGISCNSAARTFAP